MYHFTTCSPPHHCIWQLSILIYSNFNYYTTICFSVINNVAKNNLGYSSLRKGSIFSRECIYKRIVESVCMYLQSDQELTKCSASRLFPHTLAVDDSGWQFLFPHTLSVPLDFYIWKEKYSRWMCRYENNLFGLKVLKQ